MKKYIFVFSIALVAMACSKISSGDQKKTILIPVKAEVSSSSEATRTEIEKRDGKSYINFSKNDIIGIYDGESLKEFKTEQGGARAIFDGSVAVDSENNEPVASTYYAIYPFESDKMTFDKNTVNVTLPNNQKPTMNGFDPAAQIGYSQSGAKSLSFSFKNAVAFAKIKVSTNEKINLLGILALNNDNPILSGTLKIDLTDGTITQDGKNVWPSVQFNTEMEKGVYYLALNPGTYDLQFYAESADGKKYSNKTVTGVTFAPNQARYLIDLKDEDLIEKTEPGTIVTEGSLELGTYLLTAEAGSGTIQITERTGNNDYRYWISQHGAAGTTRYTTWDVKLWYDEDANKSYVVLYKKNASTPYAYMALYDNKLSSQGKSSGLTQEFLSKENGKINKEGALITTLFSVYKLDE